MFVVYALVDPRNDSVFYIGQTGKQPPEIRFFEHVVGTEAVYNAGFDRRIINGELINFLDKKERRIIEILNENLFPEFMILEYDIATRQEALEKELYWTCHYLYQNYDLVNGGVEYIKRKIGGG